MAELIGPQSKSINCLIIIVHKTAMPHSPGTVTLITNNFCFVFPTTQKT